MEKIKYLEQHMKLEYLIRNDMDRLECMQLSLSSLRSSFRCPDPIRTSPCGDAVFTGTIAEIESLTQVIQRKMDLRLRLEKQINQALEQMCKGAEEDEPKFQFAKLIRHRFIMHRTMEETARDVSVNRATVYRWIKQAIALFPMPEDPVDIDQELSLIIAAA